MENNNQISIEEAKANGVDFSMMKVCKKLRELAILDRLIIDNSQHGSKLNRHLFSYIEYCGLTVENYIRQYLSSIQPYMITRYKEQEKEENFICVLDNLYRVSLYIKRHAIPLKGHRRADKTFEEEVVISFHENNRRGIAKENNLIRNLPNRTVPVFADSILSHISDSANYVIKLFVQRGMLRLPIEIPAIKCENGTYLIREDAIETQLIERCNQYIRDLYTSDLDLNLDNIELFSVLQQISFTSYGNDIFSSLSLLIDNMDIQKDQISRKAADFALVTYTQHLFLDEGQKKDLIRLLGERYKVSSKNFPGDTSGDVPQGIQLVLARINDTLLMHTDIMIEDVLDSCVNMKEEEEK